MKKSPPSFGRWGFFCLFGVSGGFSNYPRASCGTLGCGVGARLAADTVLALTGLLFKVIIILAMILASVGAIGLINAVIDALRVFVANLSTVDGAFSFGAAGAAQRAKANGERRES